MFVKENTFNLDIRGPSGLHLQISENAQKKDILCFFFFSK